MGILANLTKRFRASADSAYQTAGYGGRSVRWRPSGFGPNSALDYSLATLRNQSREQVRKNPVAASAVERIVSNVVGTGIKPKAPTDDAGALWLKWTDESAADGMLDFFGQQQQIMASVVTAGEVFVRFRARLPQDGLSVPLQLEVLESEFVDATKNEVLPTGNLIRQGVEFDANVRSKRVAYWIYRQHPDDATPGVADTLPYRVPASEILHIFLPTRPGQIRGEPWMARVLATLKDVADYKSAELVRKKTTAMYAGFIRRPTPEGLTLEDMAEIWGSAEDDGGVGSVTLEPGTMQVLAPGEEVEFSDPKDVGGMYEVFLRQQHREIAAGVGILYEQLTGDYGSLNDRTWRAAVTEFRRRCEGWQHHLMVYQLCRPVWRKWAETALLAGVLKGIDPTVPVSWTPPRWPYINPTQDIEATEREIRAGLTSRSRAVSERGEDAIAIDAEQVADNKRADAEGLRYDSDARVSLAKNNIGPGPGSTAGDTGAPANPPGAGQADAGKGQ
jgi:lambda family phage portal protein